jgi:hypothetical protein
MEDPHVGHHIPLNISLWGYIKDVAYIPSMPAELPELRDRIQMAIQSVTTEMLLIKWEESGY